MRFSLQSERSPGMWHNVLRLCVCLPLAQSFKFTTNVDGANSTKPLLYAGTVDLVECLIGKPNGVICVFADEPFTSRLIVSNLDWFKIRITWDKMTGSNFLNAKKMPLKQTEDVVIFSGVKNGQYTYNPILTDKPKHNIRPVGNRKPSVNNTTYGQHNGQYSADYDPTKNYPTNLLSIMAKQDECNSVNRWHPTQKPTEIMQWLVKTFSNQHETVFDGYSGSGVTAIACEIENRNFIGSELNEEYYKKALQRIKDETAQLKIF
jgi:site-specific DNA-methyltransferase (adenine-specific)